MNRAWMRDPLRAGMEARVRGTQRLALGAALTLAFFALALKLCAAMEGAAVLALVGAGCAALLLVGLVVAAVAGSQLHMTRSKANRLHSLSIRSMMDAVKP